MRSHNTSISWHRVLSSEDVHFENARFEYFHQLKFNCCMGGPLEIGVIFSSDSCNKSSIARYNGTLKAFTLSLTITIQFYHS